MVVVILCVGLLIVPAMAQTRPAAPDNQATGTVTGNDVLVRSGPSSTAYQCAKVHKGATVTIVGKSGEWVEILPVPGTFSVIQKEFVTKEADGTGTVKADSVYVRAGGELHATDFWNIHGKLNKGDKVKIQGEIGTYYKIDPPGGAHFFVSGRYVSTEGGAPLVRSGTGSGTSMVARTGDTTSVTTRPNGGGLSGNTVTVTRNSSTTQRVVSIGPKYNQEYQAFEAAEKAMTDEWNKPAEQRDVKGLLAKYKDINPTEEAIKPMVEFRIQWLEKLLERRASGKAVDDLMHQVFLDAAKIDQDLAAARKISMETRDLTPRYAAQGVLGVSNLFTGGATGPKRYVLRDPATLRVDAYIQCTTGAVTLDDFMGKFIGVKGSSVFDKSMKLDVVEVKEVIVLNPDASIPESPRPTVKETSPAPPSKLPTLPPPSIEVIPAPKESDVKPPELPKPTEAPKATEPAKADATETMDLTDMVPPALPKVATTAPASVPTTKP